MRITIDTELNKCIVEQNNEKNELELYSKESFEIITNQWLKTGWNQKYGYNFSWFGRPIIQLPEDMIRIQEVIYALKPDVIVETGVAHGGSLIYYASLCKAIGKGRVIGIDIEIKENNRKAIENHELSESIELIEGSSISDEVINKLAGNLDKNEKILVILDSCHTAEHVYRELELYSQFVTLGSYIVVQDGVMEDLWDVPRGQVDWKHDNPVTAVQRFLDSNSRFVYEKPEWIFNESNLDKNITHWNKAWLKRVK